MSTETSISAIYGYEVLIALVSGAFVQAGYATIQTVVPAEDTSYAIAYKMLAQFTGIVMSLSIDGAIFINEALKSLKALLPMLPNLGCAVSSAGLHLMPSAVFLLSFARGSLSSWLKASARCKYTQSAKGP